MRRIRWLIAGLVITGLAASITAPASTQEAPTVRRLPERDAASPAKAATPSCHGLRYDDGSIPQTWRSPGLLGDTMHAMRFTPLFECTLKTVEYWLGGFPDGMVGVPGTRVSIYSSANGLPDSLLASQDWAIDSLLFVPGGPNVADFSAWNLVFDQDFHVVLQRIGSASDTMILFADAGGFGSDRASIAWDLLGIWSTVLDGFGSDGNFPIRTQMCCSAPTGDTDDNDAINATDIIYLVNYVFKSGPEPRPCYPAGDVNCDQLVTAADVIYLVLYVFKTGPAPCDISHLIAAGLFYCP